ncbi:polysaccharide biosynthesis protein [Aeromicrobium chenweiae]|uniref:Polysaccharide biosynthesis protein n=2 Tax=Aeromicrobium chenweiae TaxID=2079793 RepID=A0A2S0WRY8_9ACTN|nr:polysaccharide biosynthesis protein [Aeromicrobium chenweiae]TGN31819.1 polysaccharide biosynthesis protein [Aeromicrobium chenweiae]
MAAAWRLRLPHGRAPLGSFEELFLLGSVLIGSGAVATAVNALIAQPFVPRTAPISAAFIALVFCGWPRALWRLLTSRSRPRAGETASADVIVVGAGDAGRELVRSMQHDPQQHWRPVAFVDDDRNKKHLRHRGVGVLGTTDQLGRVASRTGASTAIIAIPSATSTTISRINDVAVDAELDVKVLPTVDQLLLGVHHSVVRDLEPEDLLGRRPVSTDLESIAGYLAGKRVLVTGAGGSIGSELCHQIARFGPASLITLDRDESALHTLLLSMSGRADLESDHVVLADIRDARRIHRVFDQHRPQVVFHAAALKHVNMLERHAGEAVSTNVLGTLNVLEAAARIGTERFVNISTDKAADPVNVLGYTKRIAERLTASFAYRSPGIFLSVRFGNVLGTRGSVLRTFAAQIAAGGPVTVTDADVTRYFMTVNEAVQLVIQAAAIGRDGETLVLDMGDSVRIADVARQMIEQARKPVPVVLTGLKPGEKLHEVLFGSDEADVRPVHPLISHVHVPPVEPSSVRAMSTVDTNDAIVRDVASLCERRPRLAERRS